MKKELSGEYIFYQKHYHHLLYALIGLFFVLMIVIGIIFYQVTHRPTPLFYAIQKNGKEMSLTSFNEPNLLPETIIRWASKAATLAYTLDFYNYERQLAAVRPYFTDDGWTTFSRSISNLINSINSGQLFVNGVVSDIPVISNQGDIFGTGMVWRVQIPFLVTYQSANTMTKRRFMVILTVVRVPPAINPQGIGIDQFVMVGGS